MRAIVHASRRADRPDARWRRSLPQRTNGIITHDLNRRGLADDARWKRPRQNPYGVITREPWVLPPPTPRSETRYQKHQRLGGRKWVRGARIEDSSSVTARARDEGKRPPYPNAQTRALAMKNDCQARAIELEGEHPGGGWTIHSSLVLERVAVILPDLREIEIQHLENMERWDPSRRDLTAGLKTFWKDKYEKSVRELSDPAQTPDWLFDVGSFGTQGRVGIKRPSLEERAFIGIAEEAVAQEIEEFQEAAAEAEDEDDDDALASSSKPTVWESQIAKGVGEDIGDYYPASRVSPADLSGNVTSLLRNLTVRTYLVCRRRDTKQWEFPCAALPDQIHSRKNNRKITLSENAIDLLESKFTSSSETMLISHSPIGHFYDVADKSKRASWAFRVQITDPYEFSMDLFKDNDVYDEYAFLSRDELLDVLWKDADYLFRAYIQTMLFDEEFPISTERQLPPSLL